MVIDKKDSPDGEKEDQEIKWKEHNVDIHLGRNIGYLVGLDRVHDGKNCCEGGGSQEFMLNSLLFIPSVNHQRYENKAGT